MRARLGVILEPAVRVGDADSVDAVTRLELGDGDRDLVPDGAFRQMQMLGDLLDRRPPRRRQRALALPVGQWARTEPHRRRGQFGVDDLLTTRTATDGGRE